MAIVYAVPGARRSLAAAVGSIGAIARGVLLAILVASMLAACGGSGPKIPPLPSVQSPPPRLLWEASVGRTGQGAFMPVVQDDAVLAASQDGTVVRIDASNGREIWRTVAARNLSAGVGANPRLVVVGTLDGEVIALDAMTGKPLWRTRVSSEIPSAPLVLDDLVIVRSADAKVFAFEAADGKRRWVFQRTLPQLTVRTAAGSVGQRGLVYAGFAGGKLAAITVGNGGLRWEGTVSLPKGATELERVSDVVGAPWLGDREVCAVSFQGRAACFDINTGTALWTKELSSRSGLTGDARLLFVSDDKGGVVALDRSTGASLWRQDQLVGRTLSVPGVTARTVIVGDMQGYVHLLARDTGAFVARLATDGSVITAAPVAIAGGALVQTTRGALIAFALGP